MAFWETKYWSADSPRNIPVVSLPEANGGTSMPSSGFTAKGSVLTHPRKRLRTEGPVSDGPHYHQRPPQECSGVEGQVILDDELSRSYVGEGESETGSRAVGVRRCGGKVQAAQRAHPLESRPGGTSMSLRVLREDLCPES